MERFLITGGSGFIGTNLIEVLLKTNVMVLNVDLAEPKLSEHCALWKQVDIRDTVQLRKVVNDFQPEYVIHLAARTDLKGKTLSEYDSNIYGVVSLMDALEYAQNLKRVVFASSMYVCEPGYMPQSPDDYAPHTLYGKSKVETERRIKERNPSYIWSIIRPTSIWGPWFGEPYYNFFRIVMKRMFFHMGNRACKKTYGYVDNTVFQILTIIKANKDVVNRKVFYLGDYEPYDITEWSNEIASELGIWIPKLPYLFFVIIGWVGDFFQRYGIVFPMTSFRLHNMTTNNVQSLDLIKALAPNLPVSRKEGNKRTIEWIKMIENK